MRTIFLRALQADDKEAALRAAIQNPAEARGRQRFDVEPASFAGVPGSPFTYLVSERVRKLFKMLPPFETGDRKVKQGLVTTDDIRFVRTWCEVPATAINQRWFSYSKGGSFSPFYADIALCVDWLSNGSQSWAIYESRRDVVGGIIKNSDYYFRAGLTWPHRSASFSAAAMPSGCVFSQSGKAAFASPSDLLHLLALFNAAVFTLLARAQSDAVRIKFEVGIIQQLPIAEISKVENLRLANLSRRAWSLKRSLDKRTETSHAFVLPALLQVTGGSFAERAQAWAEHVLAVETDLRAIQAEIDERCFDLYGIDKADRRSITEGFGAPHPASTGGDALENSENDEEDGVEDSGDSSTGAAELTAELISWAVGAAFGRFDVRLATGARPLPAEPEPFDPLPVASPGMLTGEDGLPLPVPPDGYPLAFPADGLLADDPGHPRDITAGVRAVFEVVFGREADARLEEAGALLDPVGKDLRGWIARELFEHHLKRHSKSRRKAPILWQLAPPSAGYSVWVYAHRLKPDTLYAVQNDFAGPKLTHEERKLTRLVQDAGSEPTSGQRREIAAQETVVEELRAFLDEVKRVAPLWKPDLDDGVVITLAPLWRLFPHQRPWQRELKVRWDELSAGKYDWARISMQLWPECVVPRCAEDRSLAIAHGLEETFWEEGQDGKWRGKEAAPAVIQDLVRERTSQAVKAALDGLLAASGPTASRGAGRTRSASAARDPGRATIENEAAGGEDEAAAKVFAAIERRSDGASKAYVLAETGLTESQWDAAIRSLVASGKVTITGQRRGKRYWIRGDT